MIKTLLICCLLLIGLAACEKEVDMAKLPGSDLYGYQIRDIISSDNTGSHWFLDEDINKWSKWKPIVYNKAISMTDEILKECHYGFTNVEQISTYTYSDLISKSIYYKRLSGNDIRRAGDFRNYNHEAYKAASNVTLPNSLLPYVSNVINFGDFRFSYNGNGLCINDILNNGSINRLCIGLFKRGENTGGYFKEAPIFNGSNQKLNLILISKIIPWEQIGYNIKICFFIIDRGFISRPFDFHLGLDSGMRAYPIITDGYSNVPLYKEYTLSSFPNVDVYQLYNTGSDTMSLMSTTGGNVTFEITVKDRASSGIGVFNGKSWFIELKTFGGAYETQTLNIGKITSLGNHTYKIGTTVYFHDAGSYPGQHSTDMRVWMKTTGGSHEDLGYMFDAIVTKY